MTNGINFNVIKKGKRKIYVKRDCYYFIHSGSNVEIYDLSLKMVFNQVIYGNTKAVKVNQNSINDNSH